MKKVLVTGATGFVGNYVVNELLKQQCTVIASSSTSDKAKSFEWYPYVSHKTFDLKKFDNRINYFKFFEKPDLAIHLAWEGLPNYKSSLHLEKNLPGHIAFIENLVRNGLHDLSVTGTCLEYGMQEGCLREDMPVYPSNPYAIAKNELHLFIEELKAKHDFAFKWIRLFYMYGRGQNPNSLLSQLDKALEEGVETFNMSGGEQSRDYLPVEKVAEYIVKIALQNKITGIINCCSGVPVTIKKLVEDYLLKNKRSIKLTLGYYPYPDYEPMHFWGDNSKLKSVLNNE